MKPTSLIFLALSVVLFFGGLVTCGVASSMADEAGVDIYELTNDEEGNLVYTYELSNEKVHKLSLTFSDVDVTVVGGAEASYVELKNFDVYSFATTVSGSTVSVDGTVSMMSSMIDLSGGGLRFKGLRYFLVEKPDPSLARSVTVYLSEETELSALTLNLKQGSVSFLNLPKTIDYSAAVTDGDITFDHVTTESVVELYLENANLTVADSLITTLDVTQNGGSAAITLDPTLVSSEFISYQIAVENGTIFHNGVAVETPFKVVSPAPRCLITISAENTQIQLTDTVATTVPTE